jgi:hypothetical protein
VAAAFFALSIAGLTACGAGTDAETGRIRPDNASAQEEDIKVQNVNVILPDGTDGPGAISARLFNEGTEDQVLEAIGLADSDDPVELIPAEGESRVIVPAGGSVALGGEGNAAAYIADPAGAGVALGDAQGLVFLLSDTGEVSLSARVVTDSEAFAYYDGWGATPTPQEPEEPEDTTSPADEEQPGDGTGEEPPGDGTGETAGGESDEAATDGATDPAGDEAGDAPVEGTGDGAGD